MFKRLCLAFLVITTTGSVTFAQTSVADLQRTLPYAEALKSIPGLTYQAYIQSLERIAKSKTATSETPKRQTTAPVYVPSIAAPVSGTTTKIGNTTFTNWSDGQSATSTPIGNSTYTSFSDGSSATKTQIGNFGFTNFSNGTSGTSHQIGSFGFTNYSNGVSSTTTTIGSFTFTNFS